MSLASVQFLVFLSVIYLLWRYAAPGATSRNVLLLGASYFFYGTWDVRFLSVLVAITVVQWVLGARIFRSRSQGERRRWLAVSVLTALGNLAYFKYAGFFVSELSNLLTSLGLGELGQFGRIVAPIGISFYTFQSLTYTIDIYRGQERPTRNLLDFALFLAFFGHVTAGPISRARLLMPQIGRRADAVPSLDSQAVFLVCRGLIKKLAIGDVLAAEFVGPAFSQPTAWSSGFLAVAVIAYSFQIYMDVSGYTDLARGAGRCFGLDLAINFDRPYLARSVSNFWQRWHMSMSSFFRDYLYFGLGGSRRGNVYANLILTFVCIGLWHGAGWNFVLYGLLHGSMVCFERWRRLSKAPQSGISSDSDAAAVLGLMKTFVFVALSRILFVETDLTGAAEFVTALATSQAQSGAAGARGYLTLAVAVALHFLPRRVERDVASRFFGFPPFVQAAGLMGLVMALIVLASDQRPFVYFGF